MVTICYMKNEIVYITPLHRKMMSKPNKPPQDILVFITLGCSEGLSEPEHSLFA